MKMNERLCARTNAVLKKDDLLDASHTVPAIL